MLDKTSHIDIDVAIEIINGMIADAYVYINKLDYDLDQTGISYQDYLSGAEHEDFGYEENLQKISQYRNEISQIYNSENINSILLKVETLYAPFLKQKHIERVKIAL